MTRLGDCDLSLSLLPLLTIAHSCFTPTLLYVYLKLLYIYVFHLLICLVTTTK